MNALLVSTTMSLVGNVLIVQQARTSQAQRSRRAATVRLTPFLGKAASRKSIVPATRDTRGPMEPSAKRAKPGASRT